MYVKLNLQQFRQGNFFLNVLVLIDLVRHNRLSFFFR